MISQIVCINIFYYSIFVVFDCNVLAGSRSNSPPRLTTRSFQPPPDVAAIPRPSSSLSGRIRQPIHRVAQSQGNSRDGSPTRRNEPAARGGIIRRASDLEAAVQDAWVRNYTTDICHLVNGPVYHFIHRQHSDSLGILF